MDSVLDTIRKGNIAGFLMEIPQMLQTSVSRVFIFRNAGKVLKIYRRDSGYWNEHFSDISKGKNRIAFIREDFAANHAVNPEMYRELVRADIADGAIVFRPDDGESDELVIVMKYVDMPYSFADRLFRGDVVSRDAEVIGEQFANIKERITLPEERPDLSWDELARQHVPDLKAWMTDLVQFLPSDITNEVVQKLSQYIETHKERFGNIRGGGLVYAIDAHGENALWQDGKFELFDILLPMARWRWTPKEYDIFRVGTDIFALAGEDTFEAYIAGAKKVYGAFDDTDRDFYLLYFAALMMCIFSALAVSTPEKEPLRWKYDAWFRERLRDF